MMNCLACDSTLSPPDDEGWRTCPRGCGSFLYNDSKTSYLRTENFTDPLDRAEDEAALKDLLAAEGIGIDRSMGA